MRADLCIRALPAFLLVSISHARLFRRDGWMEWWNGGKTTMNEARIRRDFNASGSVDVPGVDLSRPYPGAGGANVSGWSLAVHANGLLPMRPASSAGEAIFTASSMSSFEFRQGTFAGPEPDVGWSVCVWYWLAGLDHREDIEALRDDSGFTCKPLLPDSCLSHLEQLARDDDGACGSLTRYNATRTGECDQLQGIASGHRVRLNTTDTDVHTTTTNMAAAVRQNSNASWYYNFGSWGFIGKQGDEAEARMIYDKVVTDIMPVLVAYHWHDRAGNGSGNATMPYFRCVRPADLQPGSSRPLTDGGRKSENGASLPLSPGGRWALGLWAPVVVCSLAVVLL